MTQRRLGIDFGNTGIKVTEASIVKGVATIHWQGVVPVKSGAIASGILTEEYLDSLASELKSMLTENKIKTKAAIVGVNAVGNVFASRAMIEHHDPRDIRQHLGNMVAHDSKILGAQLENVVVDLAVLDEIINAEDKRLDVFVCAVRDEALDHAATVIARAGLHLIGVDLNPLASLRAIETVPRGMGQVDVLVDIGADVTSVLIHESGKPVHLQLGINTGGNDADIRIAEAMQQEDATITLAQKVRADRHHQATAGLENYYRALVGTIEAEMSRYLKTRRTAEGVAGITLVGGGSLVPGLVEWLGRNIDVPVVLGKLDSSLNGAAHHEKGSLSHIDYTASLGLATGGNI